MAAVAVAVAAAPSAAARPFVPSSTARHAIVWAVGDGGVDNGHSRKLAAMIAARRHTRFIYLGDVYQDGTAAEYATNYKPIWGRFDSIAAPTPGNHEWPNRLTGYFPYWRASKSHRTPRWYAFRLGNWQFLSLNSQSPHRPGSHEMSWLGQRLKRPGTCRVAFWHRPRYSAGKHGDAGDMAPIWNALRGHAVAALSGHDHNSEVLSSQAGITPLIAGGGGNLLGFIDRTDPRLLFGDRQHYAALRLVLNKRRIRYTFVSASGRELYRGVLHC